MKGRMLGSGLAVFVGFALGCAPKPAAPPPPAQAEVKPEPAPAVVDDRVDLTQLNQIVEDWHKAWKSANKAAEKLSLIHI